MGKGSNGGFNNTPGGNGFHSFTDNLPALVKRYPLIHGQFGKPSDNKNNIARIIECKNPVEEAELFFKLATKGSLWRFDKPGLHIAKRKDGSFVTFREISFSMDKSPAIDINMKPPKSIKTTKIHFVKK